MASTVQIEGFHGTSKINANVIIKEGFKLSEGDNQWVGDGVYFFTDDIGDGQQNAIYWAKYKAWDKKLKQYTYPFYAVIKSQIEVEEDKILDLTTHEGVEVFEYIVEKCKDKLKELGKQKVYIDGYVINFGRNELKMAISVVKTDVFIKLKPSDRNLSRRTPNCTICAIADLSVIKGSRIVEHKRVEQ